MSINLDLIKQINNIIWVPVYFLLVALGLYFSFKTNFLQIRKFGFMLKNTIGTALTQKKNIKGSFTPLQALTTSLAGTIGAGNIVGVAVAIVSGGPGAVFWIWIVSFFGMIIKYAEIVLALKFREKNNKGEWCGGPMYYIKNGLKKNWFAVIFSIFLVLTSFTLGNIIQSNSISQIVNNYLGLKKELIGIILLCLIFLSVKSGMGSVGKITEKLVPVMSILYFLGSLFVLVINYKYIPMALKNIFGEAFKLKSISTGVFYGLLSAIHYGIARGMGSSEAGIGTSPVAQAASSLDQPVEQALYGILEVFVSLIIVCTSTALVILTSNIYDKNIYGNIIYKFGLDGLDKKNLAQGIILTSKSFGSAMGPNFANIFIMVSIVLFSLSTIIGYFYYGLKAYEFVFKNKFMTIYKLLFFVSVFIGSIVNATFAWEISDLTVGLMACVNLVSLFFLRKIILDETKIYFDKIKIKS